MSITKTLVVVAAILGGLLAGVAADKSVVQLPGWRQIGLTAWAEYTRGTDLSRGLVLYPLQGIGALLCSVAAAVSFRFNRASSPSAAVPVYLAALLAPAAFAVTRYRVAPEMLSLNQIGNDAAAVQRVFTDVQNWWAAKAILHVLTFFANVWALAALGAHR